MIWNPLFNPIGYIPDMKPLFNPDLNHLFNPFWYRWRISRLEVTPESSSTSSSRTLEYGTRASFESQFCYKKTNILVVQKELNKTVQKIKL
jgi:hypothetical protein